MQRRVGTHLYVSQIRHGYTQPTRWRAIRLAHEPVGHFASAPESQQFTSPRRYSTGSPAHARPSPRPATTSRRRSHQRVRAPHEPLRFLRAASGGRRQPAAYQQVTLRSLSRSTPRGAPAESLRPSRPRARRSRRSSPSTCYGTPVNITAPPYSAVVAHAPTAAPEPIPVSPSRVFERLLFLGARLERSR